MVIFRSFRNLLWTLAAVLGLAACSDTPRQLPAQLEPTPVEQLDVRSITMNDVTAAFKDVALPDLTSNNPKLLIVGLDGLTPYFFEPLRQQGKLPNLDGLMKTGAHGTLMSSILPSSVVAWTTANTGHLPADHGMTSFFVPRETGELGLINTTYRHRKALWELASEQDRSSIVINVPGSYPPDPIKGIVISGLLAPREKTFTFPDFLSPLLRSISYYTTHKPLSKVMKVGSNPFSQETATGDVDDIFTITFNRAKVGLYFQQRCQADLFYIVFTLLDRLQHSRHLMPGEILENAIVNLDAIVGEFLKQKNPETPILIFSDHGFREYKKGFIINRWLEEKQLITPVDGQIDTKRSRTMVIDTVGNYFTLRVSVKGHEKNGLVSAETRMALLSTVKKDLSKLLDPWSGQPLVQAVMIRSDQEVADYPHMADMTVELTKEYLAVGSLEPQGIFVELHPPIFDHEREGYFIINGTAIKPFQTTLDIQDMTPLALYLLDLPIPSDLTGRMPDEVFKPGQLESRSVKTSAVSTMRTVRAQDRDLAQEQDIIEYLQSLGYTK